MHLPKTGGMTLRDIVARQYKPHERLEFKTGHLKQYRAFLERPQAERDAYRLLYGHMCFGYHQGVSGESVYITMLRDPMDRVISQYYAGMLKRETGRSGPPISVEEWLTTTLRGNAMTRMLVGFRPDAPKPSMYNTGHPLPDDAAEIAIRNLSAHFAVVGLTEAFDTSLLLLRRAFGWRRIAYVRKNVGQRRRKLEAVSPDTRAMIEQHSSMDFQVYVAAKALFDAQVKAYGPTLDADLAALTAENERAAQRDRLVGLVRDNRLLRKIVRRLRS